MSWRRLGSRPRASWSPGLHAGKIPRNLTTCFSNAYRTEHGAEVDFIVELGSNLWAIECKASRQIGRKDLRGLASFKEVTRRRHRAVVAYRGDAPRVVEGVDVLPWQQVLAELDRASVL